MKESANSRVDVLMIEIECASGTVTYNSPPSGFSSRESGRPGSGKFSSKTCFFRSTTEIFSAPAAATKAVPESGRTTTSAGWPATLTVNRKLKFAELNTCKVESPKFTTSKFFPSGVARAIAGADPVFAEATTLREAQSIATTRFEPEAATYARVPSGEKLSAYGEAPTGIRAMI